MLPHLFLVNYDKVVSENEEYKTKYQESVTKLKVLTDFYESKEQTLQKYVTNYTVDRYIYEIINKHFELVKHVECKLLIMLFMLFQTTWRSQII